jgi:hypothetical protein
MSRRALLALALLAGLASCENNDDEAAAPEPMLDRGADPFVFATAAPDAYLRVDRMGGPVTATVLLPTSEKDRFNAGNPPDDGDYSGFIVRTLDELHFELDDDLAALDLAPCAIDVCVRQAGPKVVPDVLRLKLGQPDGFPNGRRLEDSVVDRIVAIALLDLSTPGNCRGQPCTVDSLVQIPVNPIANDIPLLADFPYLGLPHPPPP